MCVNQRWIKNLYDGTKHYVKCGHCSACLQEKSIERKNRIDSEFNSDRECIFVTLSYSDSYVPYVNKEEAISFLKSRAFELDKPVSDMVYTPTLNVYREFDAKQSNHGLVVTKLSAPVKVLQYDDFSFHGKKYVPTWKGLHRFKNMHYVRHGVDYFHVDKIAVLNFDDIKSFYQKLRMYLKRRNYEDRYEIFYVGEYGGDYSRPHFHVLFSVPQGHYDTFKEAIIACWPYANHDVLDREIEIASDPASYLASYVNSGEDIPSFLSDSPPFRPRHKYSHGFGMSLGKFSYEAISESIARGALEYDVYVSSKGVSSWRTVPIPAYVVNRYFPNFKGRSRLNANEIYDVLQRPYNIAKYREKANLTWDDCQKVVRTWTNFRKRFHRYDPDGDWYRYICNYISSYNLHYVSIFKNQYKDITLYDNWKYFYVNIPDLIKEKYSSEIVYQDCDDVFNYYLKNGIDSINYLDKHHKLVNGNFEVPVVTSRYYKSNYLIHKIAPTLSGLDFTDYEFNPNYWPTNLRKHNILIDAWRLYCKNKRVKNEVYKLKVS